MFVGEAPGATEDRAGRPFIGDAGKVLREALARSDLGPVFITNAVRCRPPGNRAPSPQEIKACREYLDYELKRVNPKIVVTLGATATKTLFTGNTKVTQHHGKFISPDKHPFTGYVSFHPAYALRDPSKLPIFQGDISRLARTLKGENEQKPIKWSIVRRGNLHKFLKEFRAAPEFSFDLETNGLFMHGGERWVNTIGIGLPNRAWIIPLAEDRSPWKRGKALRYLLRALVAIQRRTDKLGIAWNGKFDNLWLYRMYGVRFRLDFDGMLASHTLDENSDNDLKTNARVHLDVPDYDISTKEKKGVMGKPRTLYKYCAHDAMYTLRLKGVFERQLRKEPEVHRLFHHLIMPANRALEEIELEGLTINLPMMDGIQEDLEGRKRVSETELEVLAGRRVNWNSPKQVAEVLYEDLGIKCTQFTPKGAPSTSESAIIDLKGTHPFVDELIKYRELDKFISTYLVGLRKFMVGDKLYISYKQHGTVTGRFSSRIHSIPRDGRIRNIVTAPKGWRFVQVDISQAELRNAAQLSGDLEMRRCFKEGIDIHWRTLMFVISAGYIKGDYAKKAKETASVLSGKPISSVSNACDILLEYGHEEATGAWSGWKEGRKKAKAINFGFIYGMYEKKFIETAKIKYGWEPSWDESHSCREGYFHLYSGMPRWHEKQKKLAKLNGFVRNLFGRKRRLPGVDAKDKMLRMEAERQAINAPVQGTIGDWKTACMIEVHQTIDREKFRLVGEHHDALLGIVRVGCKKEVLPQILEIVRRPKLLKKFKIRLDIPMEGEAEVGAWGAGKAFSTSVV